MELQVQVGSKINLCLDICGVLENGYHALDTVMQSVNLCDTLTLRKADTLQVRCPGVAQEQNTAYKAALRFLEAAGIPGGAEVTIQKGIPFASGMGGSSADASGVLAGLNTLYGEPLSHPQLLALAAGVGADVSFLLEGGCRRCTGIGDILTPVENNWNPAYLAVRAHGAVTAGQAYAAYDVRGGARPQVPGVLAALAAGDSAAFFAHTANALQQASSALCPDIPAVLAQLSARKGCLGAWMTGSGNVCIAAFETAEAAAAANYGFGDRFTAVLHNTPASICIA